MRACVCVCVCVSVCVCVREHSAPMLKKLTFPPHSQVCEAAKPNIGSLEIHTSNSKKLTYTYESLQFTVEMNTRGSKTPTTLIPFYTKYDLQVHSFD